jgi:phage repressor protein C with HTH and peptisase S24 domain
MENTPGNRLQNLRKAKGYKTAEEAAKAYGWNAHTYKAHEDNARGIKPKVAAVYAKTYGTSPEYILFGSVRSETPPDGESDSKNILRNQVVANHVTNMLQARNQNVTDSVPVYGPAAAASPDRILLTEDFIVGYEPRPDELAGIKGGFRMYVGGDSMEPRHFHGEKVSVHPHQFPSIGQDCVIVMAEDGNAIIKRFMGSTDTHYKVMQWNPQKNMAIKKTDVKAIYAVVR